MAKAYTKDDLKRLMQAKRNASSRKVDSPLAKYDSSGTLTCIVCKCKLSSDSLWMSHLSSKQHKEKIEAMKRGRVNNDVKSRKRPLHDPTVENDIPCKQTPVISSRLVETSQIKYDSIASRTEVTAHSSDDEEMPDVTDTPTTIIPAGLPTDFFDSNKIDADNVVNNGAQKSEPEKKSEPELPKGFFDNPVEDAKARHEPFKDPKEEEWANFQKVIASETYKSENVLGEDLEDVQFDKTVDEVEQQMSNWAKVDDLQKKAEQMLTVKREHVEEELPSEDEDVDLESLNDFTNWRSKGSTLKKSYK
ncbi:Zinc finger protein [Halotydeus destructor]|nr:Zinc finger protein [Halotydeus destructor]